MKRFIDLRECGTGYRFAFWDTIKDEFESHGGDMAWYSFNDFEFCYGGTEIDRYRILCPDWVFELENEDESL
jgi:hypothetical protein